MRKSKYFFAVLAALFLFLTSLAPAFSQAQAKKITFEQAYLNKEPRLLIRLPRATWLDDENYLLRETDERDKTRRIFKVSVRTGEKTLFLDFISLEKLLPKGIVSREHVAATPDFSTLVYSYENDLYCYVRPAEKLKRLTATPAEEEKNPRFSPDGKYLAYTRSNNLFACELETGLEHQLTSDGSETISNGWASWVYYEEILGRSSRYAAFWWSPDSRKIAFLRFDDSPVPTFPIFHAGGVHGELEIQRYPKSGDPNPQVKLGVASLPDGNIVWADIDDRADHYIAWPFWLPESSGLTFQWMNRGQDNIKIYALDLKTGGKEEIFDEKQPSWVEFFEDLYFFKDGSGFLVRSDADGWRHLYHYDFRGKLIRRLTEGSWQVESINLVDEKNRQVYFTGRKEKTTETHLFRVGLDGQGFEQLTREPGSHRSQVSPGGSYFLDSFSSVDSPTRLDLFRCDGTKLKTIERSETPEMREYTLAKKELFTIPTEDGLELPAYWILPPGFDPAKKYPMLFTIYSGPGSSTVFNSYPPLSSLFLAQEGIIVMSVDHRGSGHFGKKGMALMHRNLGKWEMHDLIEAAKWVREKPFVDRERIGITGGSYGGYTTCLALTYGADYFTHGFASASVTDWKLYDSVYTERYMDKPEENEDGYRVGSVMTHAEKLKGVLSLEHGATDDNVHMQNTIQLIDALMDLDKMFEFMLYPGQRHGFIGKKRENSNRRSVNFWFKHLLNR
ncbi:MAG: S9 family peptidase [Clostridiales bacterium]|nr:S9 family peptidase [Clostridiales bacterium]